MKLFSDAANDLADWNDPQALKALAAAHPEYLQALSQLIESCFIQSGALVLIDSSKSPEIALATSLTETANLDVVNLRRDPRAVICSLAKRGIAPDKLRKKMRGWRTRELQLRQWTAGGAIKHTTVNYATLVRHPRQTIARLLAGLPIENATQHFDSAFQARLDWSAQHLYPPANEHVLAKRPATTVIQAPTEWQHRRHWRLHLTALRFTFPQGLSLIFDQVKSVWSNRDG
jgi:hypothetical protein